VADVRMPPGYTDEGPRAAMAIRRDHPNVGAHVLAVHRDRYTAELLGAASCGSAAGVGYLVKDKVADVEEFVEALSETGRSISSVRRTWRARASGALEVRVAGCRLTGPDIRLTLSGRR
jgi:hypothetical protein